jgi:hypothetical protein
MQGEWSYCRKKGHTSSANEAVAIHVAPDANHEVVTPAVSVPTNQPM